VKQALRDTPRAHLKKAADFFVPTAAASNGFTTYLYRGAYFIDLKKVPQTGEDYFQLAKETAANPTTFKGLLAPPSLESNFIRELESFVKDLIAVADYLFHKPAKKYIGFEPTSFNKIPAWLYTAKKISLKENPDSKNYHTSDEIFAIWTEMVDSSNPIGSSFWFVDKKLASEMAKVLLDLLVQRGYQKAIKVKDVLKSLDNPSPEVVAEYRRQVSAPKRLQTMEHIKESEGLEEEDEEELSPQSAITPRCSR